MSGARYLLERGAHDDARAEYACAITTQDQEWRTTAVLRDDGSFELAPCPAPAELVAMLEMFAKLTARGAAQRRDEGLITWPARVQRWRALKPEAPR